MVVWTSLVRSISHYIAESMDHGFHTKSGSVRTLPLVSIQFLGIRKEIQPLWEILNSTTAYYIWKARCSLVFHQVRASPIELVKRIWLDMIHTLKGQYCIVGDFDDKVAQHH